MSQFNETHPYQVSTWLPPKSIFERGHWVEYARCITKEKANELELCLSLNHPQRVQIAELVSDEGRARFVGYKVLYHLIKGSGTARQFNETHSYQVSTWLLANNGDWVEYARCITKEKANEVALSLYLSFRHQGVRIAELVSDEGGVRFVGYKFLYHFA